MSVSRTARSVPGVVPGLQLEVRGAEAPELFELVRLLTEAGLRGSRIDSRPSLRPSVTVSLRRQPAGDDAHRSWQLWTLPSVLRTRVPGLAATILAPAPSAHPEAVLCAALAELGPRPAKRLHRIGAFAPDLPNEALSEGGVLASAAGLLRRPQDFGVLLGSERDAAGVATIACRLAGTSALATELRVDDSLVVARTRRSGATGLLMTTMRALAAAGMGSTREALLDAYLSALEDGLAHPGLPHLAPRVPCATDAAFLAAVRERLGRRPRWLRCPLLRDRMAPTRPRLRLVSSSA